MQLYIYEHCPYCIRVLMLIHTKKLDIELIVLSNDDVETPTKLIGKKILPILIQDNGEALPESLDIIHYLDQLGASSLGDVTVDPNLDAWLSESKASRDPITRPRMVLHPFPEFQTESAKNYFITKKFGEPSVMQNDLENSEKYAEHLHLHWPALIELLGKWSDNSLTWNDIILFPRLRNLSLYEALIVPGVVHNYMTRIAALTSLPLFHLPTRLG